MKIKTEFPDASDSLDYIEPQGAVTDNYSSIFFISELKRVAFERVMIFNRPFSYLDLGCAGGQAVVDLYKLGHVACGVDGSDLDKMLNNSKDTIGYNWKTYKDVCLFKADITKPFEFYDEDEQLQKFDIIGAWDVMEHPGPESVPGVIENVKKHMHSKSIFVAIINTIGLKENKYHQCAKPKDWWVDIFEKHGMKNTDFDMRASPRQGPPYPPFNETDLALMFKLKK